jgi:hypothetical protein
MREGINNASFLSGPRLQVRATSNLRLEPVICYFEPATLRQIAMLFIEPRQRGKLGRLALMLGFAHLLKLSQSLHRFSLTFRFRHNSPLDCA